MQVVEKFILQLEGQLIDRNVTIEFSDDTLKWLADEVYDEKMGARPISRKIQEHIKKPLADMVLFGALSKGGIAKVTVDSQGEGLSVEAVTEKAEEAVPA